ncbi:MAG: hypothetical protein IJL05_03705 [Alphaproteobacteria bacterium]|nr:hypothetical protein [Alphaproteobacteria bacterium]
MAKLDSLRKAKVEVGAANKVAGFRNAMKKYNLVAEFEKRDVDVAMFEIQNDKRSA